MKKEIITKVRSLEGEYGVKRYIGDDWNGKEDKLGLGNEMLWGLGSPWLYLTTGNKKDLEKSRNIVKKFGYVEGVVDGEANCTQLLWFMAKHILAEKYAERRIAA